MGAGGDAVEGVEAAVSQAEVAAVVDEGEAEGGAVAADGGVGEGAEGFFVFVVVPMMRGKGEPAPQKPWEGAEGLEWEVP